MLKNFIKWPLLLALIFSFAACGGKNNQLIEKVSFKPSEDYKSVRVSLIFMNTVQTNLMGTFLLKDYGQIFINPYTPTTPFELGLDLQIDVMNDPDYINIAPTDTFPNGVPMGLGYPLAEIRSPNPISTSFDIYGYVDILKATWLGAAAMFKFMDQSTFPSGMAVTQTFLPNPEMKPRVFGSIFGPTLDSQGTMVKPGGIIIMANIRQLISEGMLRGQAQLDFYPGDIMLSGPEAQKYRENPKALQKVYKKVLRAFNSAR